MPLVPLLTSVNGVGEEVDEFGADRILWDEDNPRSLINIVPNSLKTALLGMDPDLRYMSESELHKRCAPESIDGRLRLNFWDEYNLAQDRNRMMRIQNIVRNVSSMEYWKERVLGDKLKLAYICIPPKDYLIYTRQLHDLGMSKLEEILQLPIQDKKGNPNTRLIGEIIKIVQMLDLRVKGAILQKTQIYQKSLNLNVDAGHGKFVGPGDIANGQLESMEDIEKRLTEIQHRMKQLDSPGAETVPQSDALEGEVVE